MGYGHNQLFRSSVTAIAQEPVIAQIAAERVTADAADDLPARRGHTLDAHAGGKNAWVRENATLQKRVDDVNRRIDDIPIEERSTLTR